MDGDEKSKVEGLNETLYSRTRYRDPSDTRTGVESVEQPEVGEGWQSPKLDEVLAEERVESGPSPFMKKFFVFAVLFFIATILVAGYVFFGGTNFISSKNVDIEVVGPTLASAGELVELGVTIKNGNNSDLELANLSVSYPSGSRDPADSSKTINFSKEELGAIGAGGEAVRNIRVVLIGSTGELKEIKFSVEYKVRGSNATFYKDKVYPITIGSAPLTLTVESPEQVNSGDDFVIAISVALNSTEILKNVMLRAEYPYGYSVTSATPEAFSEDNVWALGDLAPGVEKKVEITGRLVGENQDERTMRFYVGVGDNGTVSPNFKTIVLSAQNTIAIERPSVGLSISFNGESIPVYIAPAESAIAAVVKFQNNLPEKILNPVLEVRFSGAALNKSSVLAQNGAYNASSNRISWSIVNSQRLSELSPGQEGAVSFNFSALPDTISPGAERGIEIEVVLSGMRGSGEGLLTISEKRTIKVASQVSLSSRATHSLGPFDNTGPIPPKVGKETTYGIIWSAGNTRGNLTNAKIVARLGTGVKWSGVHSAASENISYDETTNTVTWELGTLSSGTGFSTATREVAFQVTLTPATAQLGTAPTLVTGIGLSGFDSLLDKTVTATNPPLTTKLSSDPAFIQGDDIVVK
ncbi:MAG: hypothetical protein HYT69_01540 [Candidatus Zambryskibacteria bacterium]|nr:hypothetical protein [Candidatus Zambryskibacteria bacterium]